MRELDGASENFTGLVIGSIEAKFCNKICVGMRWKALAEIYTMHPFVIVPRLTLFVAMR